MCEYFTNKSVDLDYYNNIACILFVFIESSDILSYYKNKINELLKDENLTELHNTLSTIVKYIYNKLNDENIIQFLIKLSEEHI